MTVIEQAKEWILQSASGRVWFNKLLSEQTKRAIQRKDTTVLSHLTLEPEYPASN